MSLTGKEQGSIRRTLVRTLVLPPLLVAALASILLWQFNHPANVEQFVNHANGAIAQAHKVEKLLVELHHPPARRTDMA
jgi:predicted 2-oxoglutarate/Fe(II)-dependent dioxygenase YbiX